MREKLSCKECEFLKCYAIRQQVYFCDNKDRNDEMGKLGVNALSEVVPEWCPKKSTENK